MGRKETIPIDRKMSVEELEKRIKTLEKDTRILKRLYFVRHRYNGDSVEEAASKVGVYKMVGYQWQDRWNEDGYDGLAPRFAGGKPAKLSGEKKERLRTILQERDDWTTEEVQKLIEKRFGIRFSQKHVRTILRQMGMKYSKPYPHDFRRPKDAEERLKKT
ncbi:transcriptional regulator [uncultured archaeon]|nr:transcriptional regulator [uncultured archaeon]AKA49049.1 transcriptional regulator [uncultured archaeon]